MVLMILILGIYYIVTIFDFFSKNSMKNHKKYNLLSIFILLSFSIILLRCLYDPHFLYNNKAFLSELDQYEKMIYGGGLNEVQFLELITYYLINSIKYFIVLFFLLFLYRNFSKPKKEILF